MNLLWLLVVILVILAIVGAPGIGPINHNWGPWPSGGLGLVVLALIVLLLSGRL